MGESLRFDRVAHEYDETRGGLARGERFAERLARVLDASERLLEVGVGTGVVATALRARGFDVTGVDLSEAMLSRATGRVDRVACADASALPFGDSSFSQALSVWLLHLVADVPAVLASVARVLQPGGRYLVMPGAFSRALDPIGEITKRLEPIFEADRARRARVTAEALDGPAHAARLMLAETIEFESSTWETSPSTVADQLESRTFSGLWDVDDDTFARAVQPVIDELRAMPDEPVERSVTETCFVFEKHAG